MTEVDKKKSIPATTIDEVIECLDEIINHARAENSRLGYFAALYRQVTVKVRDGINTGDFEDNERMENLDVVFANRYIDALQGYQSGEQPTQSWLIAFESTQTWRQLIIQHLLLGMNAHINLDLGIAAALTAPGDALDTLKNDFFKINQILSSLLDSVQSRINRVSPGFGILDKVGGKTDEAIMNFSIERARDEAWGVAKKFAVLTPEEQEAEIANLDKKIERLAQIIRSPGKIINIVTFCLRIFETRKVAKVIDVLF